MPTLSAAKRQRTPCHHALESWMTSLMAAKQAPRVYHLAQTFVMKAWSNASSHHIRNMNTRPAFWYEVVSCYPHKCLPVAHIRSSTGQGRRLRASLLKKSFQIPPRIEGPKLINSIICPNRWLQEHTKKLKNPNHHNARPNIQIQHTSLQNNGLYGGWVGWADFQLTTTTSLSTKENSIFSLILLHFTAWVETFAKRSTIAQVFI